MSPPIIANTPPGVAPIVQLGVGDRYDAASVAALWGTARWSTAGDANEWGGTEPLWNDITCEVLDVSTFAGRDGSIEPFDVGTATVVVRNFDGWADYKPPTPDDDNLLTIRPGRQVRIGVAVGPGTTTPGIPAVPGYLTPTVGTATTPDPGPLPAQCCFVFKIRGPTGAGTQTVAAQFDTGGPATSSWIMRRVAETGVLITTTSADGTGGDALYQVAPAAGLAPTGADEILAFAYDLTAKQIRPWRSVGGSWMPTSVPWPYPDMTTPADVNTVLRVGGFGPGGAYEPFTGRIYSVELRSGLDPAAGSVLWRFDADDYPGTGTAYVDPRGRTWTLTTAAAITPKVPAVPPINTPAAPQWLWRGVIDVTEPGYVPDEGDIVTFGCIDAKGDAGRVQMPRTLAPVGYGEPANWRISRTLDNVSWPTSRRFLEEDNVALLPTEFGGRAVEEFDRAAESASGHVYGDLAGRVCFRRKDWMVWATGASPDATIGNVSGGDICPSGWEVRFGRDDITTRAIVGRADETPLVLDNTEALGDYFVETWERTDLLPVDNFELTRIASRVLSARAPEVMPRIAAVTLDASTGAGEVAVLLSVCSPFKPTRLRCRHRADDGRTVFDRTMLVVGITHTLSPRDGWSARLSLDDATPYQQVGNPARWDDAQWSTDDQWALSL